MTSHSFDFEHNLQRYGAALRRLAVELLRDRAAADDAVQEVWLRAAQRPPRHDAAIGGWLATILRNVASKLRRGEQRRIRREVLVARDLEGEDHALALEREEVVCRLVASVTGLAAPLREAIWQRYFEGLSPGEIARASGVPLATVKSRLQRGLQQLRDQLQADGLQGEGESDWRVPLAVAFGLQADVVPVGAAAATTMTWSGVVLMTFWTKMVAVVAMVAVVGGSFWYLQEPGVALPKAHSDRQVVAEHTALQPEAELPGKGDNEATRGGATTTDASRVLAPAANTKATLRGRCVDTEGNAIEGVAVNLRGSGQRERMAEWTLQHDEPERMNLDVTTDSDGVFEFWFVPPPPFAFTLALNGPGVASWSRQWSEWPIGESVDLGDLTLLRGSRLRGRVVDADRVPIAAAAIRIYAVPDVDREDGFVRWVQARIKEDGTFAASSALVAGNYELGIDGCVIEQGRTVTISGELAEQFVEVVLKRIASGDSISGVVVDETGSPVSGAHIHAFGVATGRVNLTDAMGRFRILKPELNAPAMIRIWAAHVDYESLIGNEDLAWGQKDVRIVLRRGKALDVLVVRADDESPVEDYVLRVMPRGPGRSSEDQQKRGGDLHARGRASVPSIRIGMHEVIVEPASPELAIGVVRIDVTEAGVDPVVVRLANVTQQVVRVQRADETPVVGVKVQLVDPIGEELTGELPILEAARWGWTTGKKGLQLAVATTDARGEASLPVPNDRLVGLFLPGLQHAPLMMPNVAFPPAGPLIVTVAMGATLQGQVGPEAAWTEIRRLAGIAAEDVAAAQHWPSIYLTRDPALVPSRFPDLQSRVQIEADGSFELQGVPPGRWCITVMCFRKNEDDRGGSGLAEMGGEVELVEGQTKVVAIDLSAMIPGELEAQVLHNGTPLAATELTLRTTFDDPTGQSGSFQQPVKTDAQGKFRTKLRAGEYQLSRWQSVGLDGFALHAIERALVRRGRLASEVFHINSGKVNLRLLDADGNPVAGVPIELHGAAGQTRYRMRPTDDEGRTLSECDAMPFTAWVLPQRLQSEDARRAFYEAHRVEPDPIAAMRLRVGEVVVVMGQTVAAELRLPKAW